MRTIPKYRELPKPDKSKLPLAWGVWGADDQVGTLNHITEETVRKAAKLVKRGVRFNLDLPLHVPYGEIKPLAHASRRAPAPTMHERVTPDRLVRDDKLDEFYLQCSSQWDGLTHMGDATQGAFYNGVGPEHVTHGEGSRNGIERVAEFGLVGRGVLVDIPRYFERQGKAWDAMAQQVVTAKDLARCIKEQKVRLQAGDILLVRLGWVAAFRAAKDVEARDALLRPWAYSGLSGEQDMWRFLWDKRVAAVGCDSVTVEVWPIRPKRPSLHLAIARLGLTIGEMFDLEALAEDCAKDGEYRCMVTSKPLNLRGGVGSPPNAIAIK
jgi:kynurenine formamidase